MKNRSQGRSAARLVMAGALAGLACLASTATAGAATLPDPLGSLTAPAANGSNPLAGVLTGTTDTVTHLLGGAAPAAPPAGLPGGLPSALPALPSLPGRTQDGGSQDGGSQDGGSQDGSEVSADAKAPSGDNLAAIDAAVASFLGVCARVPAGVVPIRADIVILDRNLITELIDAGLPLQQLIVPCPKVPAVAPAVLTGPAAGARPNHSAAPASALPASLAFTGTEVAPMLLLAGGLLALGIAFLRKANALVGIREARPEDA